MNRSYSGESFFLPGKKGSYWRGSLIHVGKETGGVSQLETNKIAKSVFYFKEHIFIKVYV